MPQRRPKLLRGPFPPSAPPEDPKHKKLSLNRILSSLSQVGSSGVVGSLSHYLNYPQLLQQQQEQQQRARYKENLGLSKIVSDIKKSATETQISRSQERRDQESHPYDLSTMLANIENQQAQAGYQGAMQSASEGAESRAADKYEWEVGGRDQQRENENLADVAAAAKDRSMSSLNQAKTSKTEAEAEKIRLNSKIQGMIQDVGDEIMKETINPTAPDRIETLKSRLTMLLKFQAEMTRAAGPAYHRSYPTLQMFPFPGEQPNSE